MRSAAFYDADLSVNLRRNDQKDVGRKGSQKAENTRLTTGKTELFLEKLGVKMRKREKTRENESLLVEFKKNQKISQKPVDRIRALVYNKRACLTGVFRLP